MRYVQVRLEDSEFEAVEEKRFDLRYSSLQKALHAALLEWAGYKDTGPVTGFMKLAGAFEATAPEQIRSLIEDNMRRFIEVERKLTPKRRKKAG